MDARMLYLHALSAIHSGTGQSTDVIDLPVARETVFGWPYLPGSSIKGVLRDACAPARDADRARFVAAFGPDTQHASEGAGALWFADGHLLCLPVRSHSGTFAWLSCPLALRRWERDHLSAGLSFDLTVPVEPSETGIAVSAENAIAEGDTVYLEDLDLKASESPDIGPIARKIAAILDPAWQSIFERRFGVVSDNIFTFFAETATEVVARIKLQEDTKTVQAGGLWYEEAVPAESIFSCPILAVPRNGRTAADLFGVLDSIGEGPLQIGGSASVGRGLVRARLEAEAGA